MHNDNCKIFFIKSQKIFILSLRDSRCDDLCAYPMYIDQIVNDLSDILTKLNLTEKEKIWLRKIYAKLNLHK